MLSAIQGLLSLLINYMVTDFRWAETAAFLAGDLDLVVQCMTVMKRLTTVKWIWYAVHLMASRGLKAHRLRSS